MSAVSEDISKVRVFEVVPLGWAMLALSHISRDPTTRTAVSRLREVTSERGVLQLDAHLNMFDILASICTLAKVIPDLEYAAGLMTAKWTNSKSGGDLFKSVSKLKDHMSIQQVIRHEDVKYVSEGEYGRRKGTNSPVMENYLNFIDRPHAIGNIAPYGSRLEFMHQKRIRDGVVELVRDFPFVCTIAKPVFPTGFRLYLSPLINPLGNISADEIRTHIQNNFSILYYRMTGNIKED